MKVGGVELFLAGHAANLAPSARRTARVVRPGVARAEPPSPAAPTPGDIGTPALPVDAPMPASLLDGLALVAVVRCPAPGVYQLLSLRGLGAGPVRKRARPARDPAAYYTTPQRARRAGMRHLGVLVWSLVRPLEPGSEGARWRAGHVGARLEGYGLPDTSAEPESGR